jgi:hypothetical protein
MEDDIKARFLRDVRNHKITIENDNGVHRCIHLGRPGSSAYHFRLITFPGGLAISGDMGDYTFTRLNDMFEFFRDGQMLNQINKGYWHEKMRAQDKHCPSQEFSVSLWKEAITSNSEEWEIRLGDSEKIMDHLQEELLEIQPENIHEAYELINDYQSPEGHYFQDFEARLMDYSMHFKWCLYAIVWGIKQYDLVKEHRTQADWDKKVLSGEI